MNTVAVPIPRLGKAPPHHADHPHRQLKMARYTTTPLPDPPASVDWTAKVHGWGGDYKNFDIGDCACAAPAHQIQAWTANTGTQRDLALEDVLVAYRDFGGYVDGQPDTDQGCVISDVLKGWANDAVGIGHDVLAGFVEVEHKDQTAIKQAIALFGGCILGVQLPVSAQGAAAWTDGPPAPAGYLAVPSLWGGPFDFSGDWKPGSWGGHCITAVKFTVDGVTVVSWGNEILVSWRWLSAYIDEAWAPLSKDWIAAGKSPSGFDLAALQADLAALKD